MIAGPKLLNNVNESSNIVSLPPGRTRSGLAALHTPSLSAIAEAVSTLGLLAGLAIEAYLPSFPADTSAGMPALTTAFIISLSRRIRILDTDV